MSSTNKKKKGHKGSPNVEYPGSKASLEECVRVYDSLLSSYDKLYERINIVITISGGVLLVGVDSVSKKRVTNQNPWAGIAVILSFFGLFLIAKSIWGLIPLLKSSELHTIDPNIVNKMKLYEKPEQAVEMFWIDRYIRINNLNREICQAKQKKLDSCVSSIIYAVLSICLSLLINNVGGF